ncbi:S-layer homology domain-containing protein [Sporosarcina sp. PTS2304]|uniref:S-layer homology domain-containing protein n=1 Tax=Sporosarcina sp. PTS2304 TaxID=2283194 RepID=UPI000E0D12E9|nr:S-layer homology domain-containing protein [Sporosarcina sp. PTS2304]AXI00783.1 S-layer homology domain-containing protein [Sporosarcina sp. PTS2304]
MRNFYRAVIVLLLLISSAVAYGSTSQAAEREFSDVPKHHPNYRAIHYMHEKGYIGGFEDGTFRPKEPITRKHVAKLLDKVLDLPQPKKEQIDYIDVPKHHPYYTSIMKLTAAQIVGGTSETFNPNAPITRIQMAKVLDIAFDLHMTKQNSFFDVYLDHWGYAHANAMYASGVSKGADGHYKPNDSVTRAHYAEFLYRAMEVKKARPSTDKVTKGKAWDLSNRLPHTIERILREGKEKGLPFEEVRPNLLKYATAEFTDDVLKTYYPKACANCHAPLFPYLRIEPLVRFQFTQPDVNSLNVKTVEFRNGVTGGGFVNYTFKKQHSKWKMAKSIYTMVGKNNFELTEKEAMIVIKEEYLSTGYDEVIVKLVKKEKEIELDPVTDIPYTFDKYIFNVETNYGRFRISFNSADGLSYQ